MNSRYATLNPKIESSPISQSVNQSVNQSINQSLNHPFKPLFRLNRDSIELTRQNQTGKLPH
jgi:hypothetical protein